MIALSTPCLTPSSKTQTQTHICIYIYIYVFIFIYIHSYIGIEEATKKALRSQIQEMIERGKVEAGAVERGAVDLQVRLGLGIGLEGGSISLSLYFGICGVMR